MKRVSIVNLDIASPPSIRRIEIAPQVRWTSETPCVHIPVCLLDAILPGVPLRSLYTAVLSLFDEAVVSTPSGRTPPTAIARPC